MQFKVLLIVSAIALLFLNLKADWIQQHTGSNILYDIDFPQGNIQTGFACGADSRLLKTPDGGDHWEEIRANPSGNFNAVNFPADEMNGFLACDSGNIQLTIDGGENWELINIGTQNNLTAIHFPMDFNTGFVAGMGGIVGRTNDGGRNWEILSLPTTVDLYGIYFRNNEIGWAVGDNGTIVCTRDGGMNWELQNSNVTTRLLSVYFFDENLGWVVGASRTCLKTTDGGQSWGTINIPVIPTNIDLYSVTFPDVNNGFICGSLGRIVKTTDGGNTWQLSANLFYHFYQIEFPRDPLVGWVCGLSEVIYYTNDGGGIEEANLKSKPKENLISCAPNPFYSITIIHIPNSKFGSENSELRIYDLAGKLVKSLTLNLQSLNTQSYLIWDGRDEFNQRVKPGVYFLFYQTNTGVCNRLKLTVLD